MDYGFNNRFFIDERADLPAPHRPAPTLGEYLAERSPVGVAGRLVRGAALEALDFAVHIVHVPVLPFLAWGVWLAVRSSHLRPVALALAGFLLSWVPVYEIFGLGRHLAPAVPFVLVLVAAGTVDLAGRRRHAGAWTLALVIAFAVGESAASGVQRQRAASHESQDALAWARWVAENVRGRLALARGDQLVMLFLPDAAVGGADIYSLSAPRTGLALLRTGDFPDLDQAFAWLRARGVTHLLVDGRHHQDTCFAPLLSAPVLPPFLVERYASPAGSRWPVRVMEIRWPASAAPSDRRGAVVEPEGRPPHAVGGVVLARPLVLARVDGA
jgi:hypothetical protein